MTGIKKLPFDIGTEVYTIDGFRIKTDTICKIRLEETKVANENEMASKYSKTVYVELSHQSYSGEYLYKDDCLRFHNNIYFFSKGQLLDYLVHH